MEIVRTKTYTKALKRLTKLGATKGNVEAMEAAIIADPKVGDVIQGAGGLRKVRFGYGQVGKSGGGRTIYFAWLDRDTVILITAYAKVDQEDLTDDERKLFAKLIKELTDEDAE